MKNGKALGYDQISAKIMKNIGSEVKKMLRQLINEI